MSIFPAWWLQRVLVARSAGPSYGFWRIEQFINVHFRCGNIFIVHHVTMYSCHFMSEIHIDHSSYKSWYLNVHVKPKFQQGVLAAYRPYTRRKPTPRMSQVLAIAVLVQPAPQLKCRTWRHIASKTWWYFTEWDVRSLLGEYPLNQQPQQ